MSFWKWERQLLVVALAWALVLSAGLAVGAWGAHMARTAITVAMGAR